MIGQKLMILLLVISSITAQGQTANPSTEKPFIEVQGIADMEIVPDEIYVTIGLRERYDKKEKTTVEEQEKELLMLLQSLNIDTKNLSLTTANAAYVNVKRVGKDVITRKDYQLKLGDALTVGRLFEQLDKLDMDDARITKMGHSKIDSFKREVNIRAIKAAKEKAEYLLKAIDGKIGEAIIVRELEQDAQPAMAANFSASQYANSTYKEGTNLIVPRENVQLQLIKIRASMYAKFAIK